MREYRARKMSIFARDTAESKRFVRAASTISCPKKFFLNNTHYLYTYIIWIFKCACVQTLSIIWEQSARVKKNINSSEKYNPLRAYEAFIIQYVLVVLSARVLRHTFINCMRFPYAVDDNWVYPVDNTATTQYTHAHLSSSRQQIPAP